MAVKNSLLNMALCLGGITLVCAALLAVVFSVTEEPIARAVEEKNHAAIAQVSPEFESLAPLDGGLGYITLGTAGDTVAYVVNASSVGFGGSLRLMVGFRPDGSIYNTAVLSHSETPGLGAKCVEEGFAAQFRGFDPTSKRLAVKKDGGDVDAITASTITSRAYCVALENAVATFRTLTGTGLDGTVLDSLGLTATGLDSLAVDRADSCHVSVDSLASAPDESAVVAKETGKAGAVSTGKKEGK